MEQHIQGSIPAIQVVIIYFVWKKKKKKTYLNEHIYVCLTIKLSEEKREKKGKH